jgi:hypothetical protein
VSTARIVAAVVLIVLGLVFLTTNLGLLDWDVVDRLWNFWRLWPLLLIIFGIALFFGRRRRTLAVGLIALVVLLGLVLGAFVLESTRESITDDSFTGPPAADVETALLLARLGAAEVRVGPGADEGIIEAEYRARGEVIVADTGPDEAYEVEFSQRGEGMNVPFLRGGRQFFDFRLSPEVAWDIDLDVGAVDADLDLREIRLRSLRIDAGASSVNVRVGPQTEDGATIVIQGGAASFDVDLSRELDITVRVTGGLSSRSFADAFEETESGVWVHRGGGPTVSVELSAGVSSLDVDLY